MLLLKNKNVTCCKWVYKKKEWPPKNGRIKYKVTLAKKDISMV